MSSTLGSSTSTRWKRRDERAVLLEVLAVLLERRRADAAKPAARERRLEQVARVHAAAGGGAGADDGVDLVDEEDRAFGLLQRLDDRLDALLEVAAVARAGEHRAHVERVDGRALERSGDLAALDLERQALGDGGLADAGVAHEERVVLLAPREDLDDAQDLVLAPDERVDAGRPRLFVQVDRVRLERVLGGARRRLDLRLPAPPPRGSVCSSSFEMPCETYETTSSRVTPCSSSSAMANESRSANMATMTFAPVTSSLPLDFTCVSARRKARWTPSEGGGWRRALFGQRLDLLGQERVELLLEGLGVAARVTHDVRRRLVEKERVEQVLDRDVLVPPAGRVVRGDRQRNLDLGAESHPSLFVGVSLGVVCSVGGSLSGLDERAYSSGSVVRSSGWPRSRASCITSATLVSATSRG